ncbi:type II toxin-antitoxin system Phd/YefM family antitoxin [Jiella marina]|uniref:type II toxin-antitoxin system Phd/YefM family antitoxin n=1 Tax=Jiella sp. LLJ827 TaxID=2917712 RepID=UPI0021013589|nr:type II toxin-antitoxin system prevent-host-death family antitoxin [Jiella sp. LLJ827]MCQ0988580.1 type II toxin-antitoxin system prevent-host-death family antitoxin [Jiella sp. LLJ827]
MEISISEAKDQLIELVKLAESGQEVVLTHDGHATARIVSLAGQVSKAERARLLDELRGAGRREGVESAARSQDFLYGDDGLPK